MCDYIVDMELTSVEEDQLLMKVVQSFMANRRVTDASAEGPGLMLRPLMTPNGAIGKRIVFQSQAWASEFQNLWEERKMQASWS